MADDQSFHVGRKAFVERDGFRRVDTTGYLELDDGRPRFAPLRHCLGPLSDADGITAEPP